MSSTASWQLIIDKPVAECWETLKDLTQAHHYVPGIIDTKLTTEATTGVGASRNVYQSKTRYLQETVTEWREGEGFRIRLHKGAKDSPFNNAYFNYHIEDAGQGRTRLVTTMGYTLPLGGLGKVLDLLLNPIISREIRKVAVSMKHYYETGSATQPADLKRLLKAGY